VASSGHPVSPGYSACHVRVNAQFSSGGNYGSLGRVKGVNMV